MWEALGSVGDLGSVLGLGRSPGERLGNALQYSCLENPHGQRSLASYSSLGWEKSGMTEHGTTQLLWTHFFSH